MSQPLVAPETSSVEKKARSGSRWDRSLGSPPLWSPTKGKKGWWECGCGLIICSSIAGRYAKCPRCQKNMREDLEKTWKQLETEGQLEPTSPETSAAEDAQEASWNNFYIRSPDGGPYQGTLANKDPAPWDPSPRPPLSNAASSSGAQVARHPAPTSALPPA